MIHLSQTAIHEINRIRAKYPHAQRVRLTVKPGGCADFYYSLGFDEGTTAEENSYHCGGIQIVVDSDSLQHLRGTTIDYSEDLMGGGFRFDNPNATQSCDCGNSFAIAQ